MSILLIFTLRPKITVAKVNNIQYNVHICYKLNTRFVRNKDFLIDPKRLTMAVNSEVIPSPAGNGVKLTTRELCLKNKQKKMVNYKTKLIIIIM